MYAEIAIPKTNLDTLTYSIPDNLASLIEPGFLVKVELKNKGSFGIVIEKSETTKMGYAKDVLEVVETGFLPPDLLSLLIWAKKYYFVNWGQLLNLTIPQSVYSHKQKLPDTNTDIIYDAQAPTYDLPEFPAIRKIIVSLKNNLYKTFLLFNPAPIDKANEANQKSGGIAFSQLNNRCGASPDNKNSIEIYLRLIEENLRLKKSAIVLVPEIILTPKFITRFKERLGNNLFPYHSGLKLAERKRTWHELRSRECAVVLGTRSAVFVPVKNLGLIIIDSEHDSSYKEIERHFHYNARDIAVVRAQISKAVAVLASSTPSCESFYNTKTNKYELVTVPKQEQKIKERVLLIDMRRSKNNVLSAKLRYEIKSSYAKNKPCVLYINRRGYSRVITCTDCGYIPYCSNCGIPLVLHSEGKSFICNLCRLKQSAFDFCPQCKGNDFIYQGIGTQKVVAEVKQIIHKPDIFRLDSDTEKKSKIKGQKSKLAGVLITTRLGIRDLDYSQLGLFGAVSADSTLFMPDFRAQEKTFQELSKIIQESSASKDCKVIIQTYHPDNYAIYRAVQENYLKFYEQEIDLRKKLSYPPFTRLASINISSPILENTKKVADRIEKILSRIKNISVLGPSLVPHPRKPKVQTYQFLIKMRPNQSLSNLISRKELMDDRADVDINIDPL
jgi:primosomal protein N' (replication factor Y)